MREILRPAVQQLTGSDQARAFAAWRNACGSSLAVCARPASFFNGVLTVECPSSTWVNELTYLSREIMDRMRALAPDHPVTRLRFVVAAPPTADGRERSFAPASRRLTRAALGDAFDAAHGVADDRLRWAIEAALRSASQPE